MNERRGCISRRSWLIPGLLVLMVTVAKVYVSIDGNQIIVPRLIHESAYNENISHSKKIHKARLISNRVFKKARNTNLYNHSRNEDAVQGKDYLTGTFFQSQLSEKVNGTSAPDTSTLAFIESTTITRQPETISQGYQQKWKNNFTKVRFPQLKPEMSRLSFQEKRTLMKASLPFTPESVDLLSKKPFSYLNSYKNPCWVENSTDFHPSAVYLKRQELKYMSRIFFNRRRSGDFHRIRCLPYFMLIGQPKCGSTDLFRKIVAHPEVRTPVNLKEPHWWSRSRLERAHSLERYVDLFDNVAYQIESDTTLDEEGNVYHHLVTGEGSMSTFWDNDNWWAMVGNENTTEPRVLNQHYIHHFLPNAKLILILRNPVDRLYSDYLFFHKGNKSREEFHESVKYALTLYEDCFKKESIRSCAYNFSISHKSKVRLRVGFYSVYLNDWLKVYPKQQVFVIRTEDYAVFQMSVLRDLFQFLELRHLTTKEEELIGSLKRANTRRKSDLVIGNMLPATRKLLENFYKPFNQDLANILLDQKYLWEDGRTS